MAPFTEWQNACVILGSAAAALTGLQFISMALIADMSVKPGEVQSGEAFATPAVVHFVAVLLLAVSMVMPWHGLRCPSILWIIGGVTGVADCLFVVFRMRHQPTYQPVFEDWLFRAILPIADYTAFAVAAAFIPHHTRAALFAIAATAPTLLLIAIHNAWDNVTYLVYIKRREAAENGHCSAVHLPEGMSIRHKSLHPEERTLWRRHTCVFYPGTCRPRR